MTPNVVAEMRPIYQLTVLRVRSPDMVWLEPQGQNPSVNQLRSALDLKVFFEEVIGKIQFLSL